jgi:hypothetical protein
VERQGAELADGATNGVRAIGRKRLNERTVFADPVSLPTGEEPREGHGVDRLGLSSQYRQSPPVYLGECFLVTPFLFITTRGELASGKASLSFEPRQ